jgi:CRP-like cAMP-binding protein
MVTHDDTFARLVDRTVIIADGQVVNEFLVKALRLLSRDLILEIRESVEPVTFEAGETVVRQGEEGDCFYIILEGSLDVLAKKPGGGEILVDQRQAGSYFGETALVGQTVRNATVRAGEGPVRLLPIDRARFDVLRAESAAFQEELAAVISARQAALASKVGGER